MDYEEREFRKQRLADTAQAYRQALYCESKLPARDREELQHGLATLTAKINRVDRMYAETLYGRTTV